MFLGEPLSGKLKAKIFENRIIEMSLGTRKPKGLNRIAKFCRKPKDVNRIAKFCRKPKDVKRIAKFG